MPGIALLGCCNFTGAQLQYLYSNATTGRTKLLSFWLYKLSQLYYKKNWTGDFIVTIRLLYSGGILNNSTYMFSFCYSYSVIDFYDTVQSNLSDLLIRVNMIVQ